MGLVAHPSRISSVAISFDGTYLFTSGGSDLSTNMWKIDPDVLRPANTETEAEELRPFIDLLEGGHNGELHCDIMDYFYYCQLRSQGEDSMESRHITGSVRFGGGQTIFLFLFMVIGHVPLEEVPSLMRAVGYYPTEAEISNMINEVRIGFAL
jgi:cilia- and flagella-associated protein 251